MSHDELRARAMAKRRIFSDDQKIVYTYGWEDAQLAPATPGQPPASLTEAQQRYNSICDRCGECTCGKQAAPSQAGPAIVPPPNYASEPRPHPVDCVCRECTQAGPVGSKEQG